jgi:hypothetical protein
MSNNVNDIHQFPPIALYLPHQFTILEVQTLTREKIMGTVSCEYYITYSNEEMKRECMTVTVHKQ